jgi:hypothetical protein
MARNKKETNPMPNTRNKDPPPGSSSPDDQKMDNIKQTPEQRNEKGKVTEKKIDELIHVQMPRKKEDLSKTARNNHEKQGKGL